MTQILTVTVIGNPKTVVRFLVCTMYMVQSLGISDCCLGFRFGSGEGIKNTKTRMLSVKNTLKVPSEG
jgi:hypothetical protein